MPETVAELAVSSDGVALSSAAWEENSHAINTYAPGTRGTQRVRRRGTMGLLMVANGNGVYGLAMDSSYIYAAIRRWCT